MRDFCLPVLVCFSLFFLSACHGLTVEDVPPAPAPETPVDAQPAPVGFNKIVWAIPTGTSIVSQSPRGLFGLFTCVGPYGTIQKGISARSFPDDDYRRLFLQTLEGLGYDVAGDPGLMFDEVEDMQRTVFAVGARVVDIKADICRKVGIVMGADRGVNGEATVTIEWTIFDMLTRRNMYKTETKGYAVLKNPNYEGVTLLLEEAFSIAAHNLGADQVFHDLVFYGAPPPKNKVPTTYEDPNDLPAMMFDPQEAVELPAQSLSTTPAKGRFDTIEKAAVLVETAGGHGSGYFISDQGHILTNAHVVGYAGRARIVSSGKKEKMVAEVLRIDRKRDVALLRLETLPPDLDIVTLPLRFDQPEVGDGVYAIGAPRLKKLQDTVTHGIVSAHRYDRRKHLDYIQADVDIYGGNSGGPLLDENGNIIGMSVLGYLVSADTFGGLNWFIPIDSALKAMDIEKP